MTTVIKIPRLSIYDGRGRTTTRKAILSREESSTISPASDSLKNLGRHRPASQRAESERISFLDLPGELRNRIYWLAYAGLTRDPYTYSPPAEFFYTRGDCDKPHVEGPATWFAQIPGLWGVSWQVREEVRAFCPTIQRSIDYHSNEEYRWSIGVPRYLTTFGPIVRLDLVDEGPYWCYSKRCTEGRSRQPPTDERARYCRECDEVASRWVDSESPFVILVCLVRERMHHLRDLGLAL